MDSSTRKTLFNPSQRMLRQFAGLWILFFAALAARQELHQRHLWAIALAVLALAVGGLGLLQPRAMKPIFIGWMTLVFPIGWVVSHVVLGIVYFGLMTPIAAVLRLAGHDALSLKPRRQSSTYWLLKPAAEEKTQYLKQF